MEGAGGLGRSVALRLVTAGERGLWTYPPSSLPEPVFSPRATPARTTRWEAFHVALGALRDERLADGREEEEHSELL